MLWIHGCWERRVHGQLETVQVVGLRWRSRLKTRTGDIESEVLPEASITNSALPQLCYMKYCSWMVQRKDCWIIGSFVTDPSHGASRIFSNSFSQERQSHLCPYLSGHIARSCMVVNSCIILVSSELEQTCHCLGFPSSDLLQSLRGP